MKKYFAFIFLTGCFFNAGAQNISAIDSGTFYLHKFEQHIGQETYHTVKTGNEITYIIDFKFTDRGSAVPLKAELKLTDTYEPLSLKVKGKNSRVSSINDSVSITGNIAHIKVDDSTFTKPFTPLTFPVAGYAPGTVQQELLQYWKNHHQPANIITLPFGSVQIKRDGGDTLAYDGKLMLLDRYTIGGLIWGNELIWTDHEGKMICLITNDAEADKMEMMRQPYENLLPELISRAATYSMRLLAKATPRAGAANNIIAVTGGTMLDVVNSKAIPNSVVVIENGIIRSVGIMGSVTIPANAKIIDAKGKFVLPGLWDMHAHFEQAEWGPAYLAVGVTTVRDCGNEFSYINAIKKAIDDGKGVGPEILKAGIIDGKGPSALGIIQADTKEEAIKAVDRYFDNGFIQIKIYSSVKPEIVKAICDEAHRLGLTVTGHIPNRMTLKAGVDSGMDMVNHVQYVFSMLKREKGLVINFSDPANIAAIDYIKQHHVVIDPTVGVFEMIYRNSKDDIIKMEPAFYTLPLPLQAIFKDTGLDPKTAALYKPMYDEYLALVKILYDAGVPIVAGTDQGFPGYSLDRELELYVQAGLTPMQAIQCATITPARVLKMENRTGAIEAGKQGDLVVIDGDPLTNIRDIRKVSTVIKGGKIFNPVKLHQLVGFSK
jgi:imidazolonepropionase-like amidohydrolase